MSNYYAAKLAGTRLQRCYELASPRVQQYLDAEIAFVLDRVRPHHDVLELGCGYGRIVLRLAPAARRVVGIDTARESLELARRLAQPGMRCEFFEMDALDLHFPSGSFDVVICLQNGICAFRVDQVRLILEAVRVAKPGGLVVFSTYSEHFWLHRLEWFEAQARERLIGEIDTSETMPGTIVCRDGLRLGSLGESDFRLLCERVGLTPTLTEVDGSSLFCELIALAAVGPCR